MKIAHIRLLKSLGLVSVYYEIGVCQSSRQRSDTLGTENWKHFPVCGDVQQRTGRRGSCTFNMLDVRVLSGCRVDYIQERLQIVACHQSTIIITNILTWTLGKNNTSPGILSRETFATQSTFSLLKCRLHRSMWWILAGAVDHCGFDKRLFSQDMHDTV